MENLFLPSPRHRAPIPQTVALPPRVRAPIMCARCSRTLLPRPPRRSSSLPFSPLGPPPTAEAGKSFPRKVPRLSVPSTLSALKLKHNRGCKTREKIFSLDRATRLKAADLAEPRVSTSILDSIVPLTIDENRIAEAFLDNSFVFSFCRLSLDLVDDYVYFY